VTGGGRATRRSRPVAKLMFVGARSALRKRPATPTWSEQSLTRFGDYRTRKHPCQPGCFQRRLPLARAQSVAAFVRHSSASGWSVLSACEHPSLAPSGYPPSFRLFTRPPGGSSAGSNVYGHRELARGDLSAVAGERPTNRAGFSAGTSPSEPSPPAPRFTALPQQQQQRGGRGRGPAGRALERR